MQDFCPRIDMLKGNNPAKNYGSSKSAKIVLSRSIFKIRPIILIGLQKLRLRPKDRNQSRLLKGNGFFFQKSVDELWFIKKSQYCTFKVNFQCQKSTEFSQKKLRLRPNILAKRLGGRSLSRLMKNFGLGLLTD